MSPNAAAGQTRQSEGAQATVAHRLPHPFDPHAWLDLKCMVGAGAYGRVYMAGDTAGRRFAVKQLNKTPAARREISLHQRCNGHPNVVGMFGSHEDHLGLWMILEYCPDGDLFHHITHADGIFHSDRSANEPTIKLAFSQVCDGIAWCHQRGVYHRDIKPENVLVWLERDPMTGYIRPVLKIADFGLATERPYTHDFGCGSTFYMSPECIGFAGNPPPAYGSGPTDVWSLGILLLNIVTAQNPWRQAHPREEAFVYYQRDPHNFLARLLPITDALQRCVCRALELSVRHRCTVQELRSAVLDC
ncbi:kinase-like domain-containing protein, partial [Thamnocephalis sphaerospora]